MTILNRYFFNFFGHIAVLSVLPLLVQQDNFGAIIDDHQQKTTNRAGLGTYRAVPNQLANFLDLDSLADHMGILAEDKPTIDQDETNVFLITGFLDRLASGQNVGLDDCAQEMQARFFRL